MNSSLKENQELRAAMRKVYWPPGRLVHVDEWAKRANKTPEEFINAEIDTSIDGGWGDVFQIFHANHGRYPEHAETKQAAEEYRQVAKSLDRSHWCVDLGSMNPDLYGKPPRAGNPKAEFYEGELEAELNNLLKTVEKIDNENLSDQVARIMFIFNRARDARREIQS